jgi:phage terminase large subunit
MYYNKALIAVEANFNIYPIKELTRLGYLNQYVRKREDTFTGGFVKSYGFMTTLATRPVIISELVKIARENIGWVNEYVTLSEMQTFVRNEKGRPEAMAGCHDDCVMALAIAYHALEQAAPPAKELSGKKRKLTEDEWEDWNNADEAGKEFLRNLWGDFY